MSLSRSSPMSSGRLGFVHYSQGVGDVWHERLLMCQVRTSRWIILTPDGDLYSEDLATLNFTPALPEKVPRTLAGQMLYRFDVLDAFFSKEEWGDIFEEAVGAADIERRAKDPDATQGALAVGAAARLHGMEQIAAGNAEQAAGGATLPILTQIVPADLLPDSALVSLPMGFTVGVETPRLGSKWRLMESVAGHKQGSEWDLTREAVLVDDHGIDFIKGSPVFVKRCADGDRGSLGAAERQEPRGPKVAKYEGTGLAAFLSGAGPSALEDDARDARVTVVRYDERGQRRRNYDDACMMLEEPVFKDWPVTGPRTARWMALFIKDNGGTPRARTSKFAMDAKVPEGDRVRHEHAHLMEVMEFAMVYDQVDISALACFELVCRRVALLEEAYSANPKNPRFEGSEHFTGLGRRSAAVAPTLSQHVASALQSEAQIAKERRKAREESAAGPQGKK